MKQENKDVVGEKCIRDNNGVLVLNEEEKKKAWKQHYERLLNIEFPRREKDLLNADPILGPPLLSLSVRRKTIKLLIPQVW